MKMMSEMCQHIVRINLGLCQEVIRNMSEVSRWCQEGVRKVSGDYQNSVTNKLKS